MRLKSYLLVTGMTAAALFGTVPAFADEASPAPTPAEESPDDASTEPTRGDGSPEDSAEPTRGDGSPDEGPDDLGAPFVPDPIGPQEEACWALLDENWGDESWEEVLDGEVDLGEDCDESLAHWREVWEERGDEARPAAPPADPRPADPNYTG